MNAHYDSLYLFINGEWIAAGERDTAPVVNPATLQELGRVPLATAADLDQALRTAKRAFDVWRNTVPAERARILKGGADLIRERAAHIAELLTLEEGKPLAESRDEVLRAAEYFEWFAEEARRIDGRVVPSNRPGVQQLVKKQPIGPVAAFTPWNFPINQVVRKIGAGLAAGCSMIVKAPEETPASPAALIRAFQDAGIPEGVLNLVYGNPAEISEYLIASPVIRKITFTGSTPVGKLLAAQAGKYMKRVSMELGGHAPVIVCEDADIDLAVRSAGRAKFRNAGQVCISPTRFLVHTSVKDQFAEALADLAKGVVVGDGLDEGTQMGPLANDRRLAAMAEFQQDAVARGARVLAGGARIGEAGNFWQPTVLADVPLDARLFNDEPFGPVAGIRGFDKLEEAIAEANRLSFGLAGYAFTRSLANADLLTRRVEVGMLWVNTPAASTAELPFGGIKDSGYGTEGGPEALDNYLNTRAVVIANV